MPFEKLVILLTARAPRAFQAAHQQNRYANCDKNGKQIRVRRRPMDQTMHKLTEETAYSKFDVTLRLPGCPFLSCAQCAEFSTDNYQTLWLILLEF